MGLGHCVRNPRSHLAHDILDATVRPSKLRLRQRTKQALTDQKDRLQGKSDGTHVLFRKETFMASPYYESEKLLSVADVARTLDVSERQVRRWVTSGELPAFKLGSLVRIPKTSIEDFLKSRGPSIRLVSKRENSLEISSRETVR